MKHIPGTLENSRLRNGVGRPPAVRKQQEAKWALNPINIIRACGVTLRRGDLPQIKMPPGHKFELIGFQGRKVTGCRMVSSTAALRKSKQRRGRASQSS